MTYARTLGFLALLLPLILLPGCPEDEDPGDDDSAGDDDATGDDDDTGPVDIDLSTIPDTGESVADGTVLDDQWRSIGVLFDARPEVIDPVMKDWGAAHLFFDPDVEDAVAIVMFVEPGTDTPREVSSFTLYPWFDPGESAELVGLDGDGEVVVVDEVTPDDIGNDSQTLEMSISGSFSTAEWRTHGNPGIAASGLVYEP